MPKYLFTSDQRISDLPNRIKWVSEFIQNGKTLSEISDKSDNNNATTLKFYYNLYLGTETCTKSVSDPLFSIRNFVLKFQFPNVRTSTSLNDSLNEGTLFAPFRSVVSVLVMMAQLNNEKVAQISIDEILYYLFCNPYVFKNPEADYRKVAERILSDRNNNQNLSDKIASTLQWNQHGRQSKELFTVLTYASKCFKLSKGILTLSLNSDFYIDKDYIDQILNYSKFWYPSNPSDFNLSTQEYISYMDTINTPYSVIEFNNYSQKKMNTSITYSLQQIYYGAPGTGKSHTINKITKDWDVIRTTFHPDSDYSTFVGAYKPTVGMLPICDEAGQPIKINDVGLKKEQITYKFVRQAFLNAYLSAWKKYADAKDGEVKPQFLVIEEINRGNCAQIFGDTFQLLDRADNGFSTYPIVADSDISKSIKEAFKNEDVFKIDCLSIDGAVKNYNSDLSYDVREGRVLLLPPNLYIWATMNTSDQSLFPIDSAFKRRWDWKYIKITNAYEKDDNGKYKTDEHGNKIPLNWKIKINETTEKDWWEFLDKINAIISNMTSSADKQLGYFFCKADENKVISVEKFVNKVVFYLWNDVFKDYGFEDSSLFLVKMKDKDGKDIDKDLTYPDFFDEDGKVNEEITIQFVDNVIKWSKKNENNL